METTIKPRIWEHTLLQGDDEAKLRVLRQEAERLEERAESLKPKSGKVREDALLSDGDEYADAVAAYRTAAAAADAFADEAEARGIPVVLRTLGSRKKYRALKQLHKPREGNDDDEKAGFNVETFQEALVSACLASPALGDAEREEFLDQLTDAQFELFSVAALQLHQLLGADPKGRLLSASNQNSSETSS